MKRKVLPATLPPAKIPELEPRWSRLVNVPSHDGGSYTWHLLDNQTDEAKVTVLCVHGNPSWSYLWRRLLANAPRGIRVVAVDQLGMGYSERLPQIRRLTDRIKDLGDLTTSLDLDGPVVIVGHDRGGAISLGWAAHHRRQVVGVTLLNTAVQQPPAARAPGLIRLVCQQAILPWITERTTSFIRGAWALSPPKLDRRILAGFLAPFASRAQRAAIQDFVADIPLNSDRPSAAALKAVAGSLAPLAEIPTLLFWGARDRVFSDRYLHDLEILLPHAEVHRIAAAGHYSSEHWSFVPTFFSWLESPPGGASPEPSGSARPVWQAPADANGAAVVELPAEPPPLTFADFESRVEGAASSLMNLGVRPGIRVAVMVPPGVDLTLALYGCWRLGAVAVLIDAGLGPRGMGRALASAAPAYLIGIDRARLAARVLRWRTVAIAVDQIHRSTPRDLPAPLANNEVAVVFTSGSTGPAKGVVYRHHQLQAQREAIANLYSITPNDRLVAAFAPFALFGPALGVTTAVPDMDLNKPGSLLMSAGAPVRTSLLASAAALFPNAEAHTPYGMTEMLPIADISLSQLQSTGRGDGICVGRPLDDVEVRIDPFGSEHDSGEILVRGPHRLDRYDRLAATTRTATEVGGWHRTGDVGTVDDDGLLWVGGRLTHVIWTPEGPIMPVATEFALEDHRSISHAAVVGVGPRYVQVVVAVVVSTDPLSMDLLDELRSLVDVALAAVLVVKELPVDRRHNSKIDRTRIAHWATRTLAGERVGSL